jgi:hypothetical protein
MISVNSRPRRRIPEARSDWTFQPRAEPLEDKLLLSINLGGTTPPTPPLIASAPFGMDFGGAIQAQGAGFSVANVGDVNGTGYDDFVIGAPTVSTTAGPGTIGTGINSAVYLVMGSQTVNVAAVTNWAATPPATPSYSANDRVGSLGQLGMATQTNPTNPTGPNLNFPFAGVTFINTINATSMVGASVAGLRLPSGQGAILLGAPGATDGNNANLGTGRVYLIFGAFNSFIGKTVNLDDPNFTTDFPGLNLVTFVNIAPAGPVGHMGTSVSGGSNIFGDGASDIIIGAPAASVAPPTPTTVPSNTGVVYVMSTALLSGTTQTINVQTLGQSGTQSLILSGVSSGDRAGFSVADAGDVNGVTAGGKNVDDLLIGAPSAASNAGAAYLVYGGSTLAGLATTTNGVRFINLANVGGTGTGAVPGAIITGPTGGSQTGFAVSSAGDFNNDGFSDILLGSPTWSGSATTTNQGLVSLLYGAASTSSATLTGTISLANVPTAIPSVELTGGNAGDMAGYALTPVGFINSGQPNPILIGAPGFSSSAGTAYLIPGRSGFTGTFSLANAEAAPLSGLQFVLTTPSSPAGTPNFFGASVSSRFQDTSFTADTDSLADFIIGAPGYDITQNAVTPNLNLAGGAQVVESTFISLPIPTVNTVTTQIGVGTPFAPFSINATTPASLQIFVFGSTTTTPAFMPVTDINPTTVVVNGVAFPNATLQQDPNTANYLNGIPDAIITINPRSALALPTGTDVITITGKTLATSPLPNFTWTGSATVAVTGGSVSPIIAPITGLARGPSTQLEFIPPFGSNQYTPSLTALSALNYQPIPLPVALAQFLPPQGFRQRIYSFNHPGKTVGPFLTNRGQKTGPAGDIDTLSSHVFDRSRFHPQRKYGFTHKAPKLGIVNGIIPMQQKRRQTFDDNLLH